jgi:hypothetical protein
MSKTAPANAQTHEAAGYINSITGFTISRSPKQIAPLVERENGIWHAIAVIARVIGYVVKSFYLLPFIAATSLNPLLRVERARTANR